MINPLGRRIGAFWFVLLAAVLSAAWLRAVPAEDRPAAPAANAPAADAPAEDEGKTEFLRFTEDKNGGKLESAIATYKNADGVTVHLVAALHVGEKSYYEGLSKTFEGYDALLYEMVKPKNMAAPVKGQKSGGMGRTFHRVWQDGVRRGVPIQ